jgi:monoamine oxidase
MERDALIAAALAQLARLFGPEALAPLAVHLQDWAEEADTATLADAQPLSAHRDPIDPGLPPPGADRIHLAGSEFAAGFPGYLEGAVVAAERAVEALRRALSVGHSGGASASPPWWPPGAGSGTG